MSEFQQPITDDRIELGSVHIAIQTPNELIDFINSTEESLTLVDRQTKGIFGRVDTLDVAVFVDFRNQKLLDAHCIVRPEHPMQDSSIREMYYLHEKLLNAGIPAEQISLSSESGRHTIHIFIDSGQILQLYAYKSEDPATITVKMSASLTEQPNEQVDYRNFRSALETIALVTGQLATSMHPGKRSPEPLLIPLADYTVAELDRSQVAIVLFFERQQMLVEDLDSPNAPIFCLEGMAQELIALAAEYSDVTIEAIENSYNEYTKSRYQFFRDNCIHPTVTIGDIRNILAAARNKSSA